MTSGKHDRLSVRVNDELVLDAGRCIEAVSPRGPEKVIQPPAITMYRQVLAYLKMKPDPPLRPHGSSRIAREGIAAAALILRWGSYLELPFNTAVLGAEVAVEWIDLTDDDHIVVVCRSGQERQRLPILDLPLPEPPPKGWEWIEAYRHWSR